MRIGVPMAQRTFDGEKWYDLCPECGKKIYLTERKDFESFSATEYAKHYVAEHEEAEGHVS